MLAATNVSSTRELQTQSAMTQSDSAANGCRVPRQWLRHERPAGGFPVPTLKCESAKAQLVPELLYVQLTVSASAVGSGANTAAVTVVVIRAPSPSRNRY